MMEQWNDGMVNHWNGGMRCGNVPSFQYSNLSFRQHVAGNVAQRLESDWIQSISAASGTDRHGLVREIIGNVLVGNERAGGLPIFQSPLLLGPIYLAHIIDTGGRLVSL